MNDWLQLSHIILFMLLHKPLVKTAGEQKMKSSIQLIGAV